VPIVKPEDNQCTCSTRDTGSSHGQALRLRGRARDGLVVIARSAFNYIACHKLALIEVVHYPSRPTRHPAPSSISRQTVRSTHSLREKRARRPGERPIFDCDSRACEKTIIIHLIKRHSLSFLPPIDQLFQHSHFNLSSEPSTHNPHHHHPQNQNP
jgi:hypothetical protein